MIKKIIDKLLRRDRDWFLPNTIWIKGKKYFYTGTNFQCVYCLNVQSNYDTKLDRNKYGEVVKIHQCSEDHQSDCKQNTQEPRKVNWLYYFFPSQAKYEKEQKEAKK